MACLLTLQAHFSFVSQSVNKKHLAKPPLPSSSPLKYRLTTVLPFSLMRCSMISGGGAGDEICCFPTLHCCCMGWIFSVSVLEAISMADAGRELMARSRFIAFSCCCNKLVVPKSRVFHSYLGHHQPDIRTFPVP